MSLLFTPAALAILRRAQFDPNAEIGFDLFAGGLVWSDEFPRAAVSANSDMTHWGHSAVIAFRASLIAGEPNEKLRPAWDQLMQECPNWPGFRPERRDPALKEQQDRENKRLLGEFDRATRRCEAYDRLMKRKENAPPADA